MPIDNSNHQTELSIVSNFLLQFKEFELYWGAVFLRLEEEYWRSPFLINFIGVNFEAGNKTREKIWSEFVAEQKI